ncbi:MAG: EF-hand domain-containing protein [archaeon]|nr:EF-hand domain-containing protein [archaeon]
MELDEDKIKECKVVFDLFDDDHDGFLIKDKLGDIMRVLGAAPSADELANYIKKIKGPNFDYKTFMNFFTDKLSSQESEEDLIIEFSKLDRNGSGNISKNDLVDLMKNYDNSLTDKQIEEIIKMANPDSSGNINIERFVKVLLGK